MTTTAATAATAAMQQLQQQAFPSANILLGMPGFFDEDTRPPLELHDLSEDDGLPPLVGFEGGNDPASKALSKDELFALTLVHILFDEIELSALLPSDRPSTIQKQLFTDLVDVLLNGQLERAKHSVPIIGRVLGVLADVVNVQQLEAMLENVLARAGTLGVLSLITRSLACRDLSFESQCQLLKEKSHLEDELGVNLFHAKKEESEDLRKKGKQREATARVGSKGANVDPSMADARRLEEGSFASHPIEGSTVGWSDAHHGSMRMSDSIVPLGRPSDGCADMIEERDFVGSVDTIMLHDDTSLPLSHIYQQFGYHRLAHQCVVEALTIAQEVRSTKSLQRVRNHVDEQAHTFHSWQFLRSSRIDLQSQIIRAAARRHARADDSTLIAGSVGQESVPQEMYKALEAQLEFYEGVQPSYRSVEAGNEFADKALALRMSLKDVRALRKQSRFEDAAALLESLLFDQQHHASTIMLGDVVMLEAEVEMARCQIEFGNYDQAAKMLRDALERSDLRGLAYIVAEAQTLFLRMLLETDRFEAYAQCVENVSANVAAFGAAETRADLHMAKGASCLMRMQRESQIPATAATAASTLTSLRQLHALMSRELKLAYALYARMRDQPNRRKARALQAMGASLLDSDPDIASAEQLLRPLSQPTAT